MNLSKKLIALLLLAGFSSASFAAVTDNQVFTFAAANYPILFSGTPTGGLITYQGRQYDYRHYPTSGNYLAVANGEVYFMGSDGTIRDVGPVSTFESNITSWQGSQSASMCDASAAPAGFNYSQSGNTITVTTTGCVVPPTGSGCHSFSPTATGVNVLLTENNPSLTLSGITSTNPMFSTGQINSLISSGISNAKTCIRNAPAGFTNMTLNMNICLDLTQQIGSSFSGQQGITVAPPITMTMTGSTTMSTVPDCATASGVTSIYDAYTLEALAKQPDGSWKTLQADGTFQ